jgi:SET domain-containing protein
VLAGSSRPPETSDLTTPRRFCSLFEVQPIPLKELGAIATRKIKKGELVIEESPLFVLCAPVKFLQAAATEH